MRAIMDKDFISPIYEKRKLGDVQDTYADIKKAQKILGYNPVTSIKKGLENFTEWYKLNTQPTI
jgi:nucleoside-diphosphate-sugar epimerase